MAAAPARAAIEEGAVRAQRAPAEELGKKAAPRRVAQLPERQEEVRVAERAAGGIWDALRQWLALSDHAYQALIQRLARGAEKTAHAGSPATGMPLTREENAEAGVRFWWQRSRGLFDAMMRRLAGGAASPERLPTRRAASAPAEQGGDRSSAADPPVNAAAVAAPRVPHGGPVATGPGARDAEKGAAGADHAAGSPARVAAAPSPPRLAVPRAAIAAGPGARSDTGGQAAPMTVAQGLRQARGAQRTRLRARARSASKPGYAAWHGTRHGVGHGARHIGRMSDSAAGARQHRAMRRVAVHRLHRCAAAGRRVALPGWYVVAKGDTLWRIARRHYGTGRAYLRIGAANRHRLRGRDRIVPCQRLYLPRASRRR
jgi:nucleoid-associated protein YgaU